MNPASLLQGGTSTGSSLQGSNTVIQGSSPHIQGSSPGLQVTAQPTGGLALANFNLNQGNQSAASSSANAINNSNALSGQLTAALNRIAALDAQLANKPVAPTLNYNAIKANAQQAATASVNPLYNQYLNQYLQNEQATTQEQQQQNQLSIQTAQSALGNTLAQNEQQQNFTGQNTALNIGNINQQTANRQQNSGNAFEDKRAQLENQIGQSNLGASGIGQQQIWKARTEANIQELQAQDTDQFNKNQQLLNESNTFAQLAQSGKYATTKEGEAESSANLSLNTYLRQAAYNEVLAREKLSTWQQAAIGAATQNSIAQQVSAQLGSLRGGVQGAASQAWAPFLQTSGMPEMPTLQ